MSDRTKKIIFAVVFIILSIAIAIGLYVFFFQPLVSPTPTPSGQPPLGSLPPTPGGSPQPGVPTPTPGAFPEATPGEQTPGTQTSSATTLLRDGVTQSLTGAANGQGARFYNPEDGRFYRVNPDGTITALGEKQFFNVKSVSWAHRNDNAIIEFPDGNNVYYDFTAKRQVTLPKHWQDFTFSPDDSHMAAKSIGLDPGNRFLIVANADGNEAQAVETLGQNGEKTLVNWSPNNQVIAFAKTGRPQAEGAEEVYMIGEHQENFKSLIVPGRGFLPNWSPNGQHLIYSVYHERDGLRPSLWVTGANGDTSEGRRGLNLNTWADKCAWESENSLICGVPQSLDTGAGLNRDKFSDIPDDLYRIDLTNGVSVKISTADQNHPIKFPVLSSDKRQLMFTDAATGRLYRYDLH